MTPTDDPFPADDPFFHATLRPHRSLAHRAFAIMMLAMATAFFGISVLFWWMGAWPVVGFLGLDVALVYGAFHLNSRSGRTVEEVSVSPSSVVVRRISQAVRARPDERTLASLVEALGILSAAPIFIEDTAAMSIGTIRSKARRLRARQPLDLLIVDYLQLATPDTARRGGTRTQEVDEISRGLKALARELGCPVLALAQLSRAVEGRANHVPMLSDLRESGSIEQDADIVLFIYREELYDKETEKKGIAEIHIAKHRNGPLGIAALRFEASTTQFQNLSRWQTPEGYA
jgi:replicative DNA helicase